MRVYKSLLNTIFEILSLLNIGLLSVASSYQLLNNQNSMLTTSISVSIAFIMFIFIFIYHATVKLASLKKSKDVRVRIVTAITRMKRDERQEENEQQKDQATGGPITHTSIELHEPLLEEQTE